MHSSSQLRYEHIKSRKRYNKQYANLFVEIKEKTVKEWDGSNVVLHILGIKSKISIQKSALLRTVEILRRTARRPMVQYSR